MKTYLDWSAYDTYGVGDAYAGIPATGGQYAKAVAVCMNNHQCQRDGKGVMCPSYRVTLDPAHSTGARVKAFKAALNGELGDNPFAADELAAAMDLCVSCKGCKKECPSAVDMTLIKTEYLAQRNARIGLTPRQKLFGALPRWLHRQRRALLWLARWRNRSPWVATLAERWLGIAAERPIPAPVAIPFTPPSIVCPASEPPAGCGEPEKSAKTVILFVDTFTHHFNPEVAEAAIKVLHAGGYTVRVLQPAPDDDEPDRPLCCGRSYLSQGMVDATRVEAQRVMKALAPALADGLPIIGLEPSCLLALRDEFYSLSLGPEVGQLGKQAFLLEEFLMREGNKGLKLDLKPLPGGKAVIHGHCHQKAFGTMKAMKKVLGWIPEFDFEIVDSSCCGMSGSFGMEAEHYQVSQAMGELALLPAVRAAAPDAAVIANGFSCRHQIHDGTGRQAEHIALLLAGSLAA